jgi:hypothetical protein
VHEGAALVESIAIGPNFIDVCVELSRGGIDSGVEVALDGRDVHGILNHIEVVEDSIPLRFYGNQKWKGALMLF